LIIVLFLAGIFYTSAVSRKIDRAYSYTQSLGKDRNVNMQSPFGVLEFLHWNHAWNNYKYPGKKELDSVVDLMKEAHVGWVRMDFLWGEIESEQGKFNFDKYDYIVDLLSKNDINILGLLDYSADWASSCGKWNCPPVDNKSFVNYAVKIASRYKARIKYWEIWNEPDSSTYWQMQDGLKSYSVLLKDVYIAMKEVDPDCKILNGGLAKGISSVNHLYDNGAGEYFDILNIHVFKSPLNLQAIKGITAYLGLVDKIMKRNGDTHKKIWITEIGCPGVKKGLKVKNSWMGQNPDETVQAEWLKQVFTELIKEETVEKIFWAFFRDCRGHWNNGIDYFGLVRWDFSKKPAFWAYEECFKNWKNSLGK
jgi:hypothetical protein